MTLSRTQKSQHAHKHKQKQKHRTACDVAELLALANPIRKSQTKTNSGYGIQVGEHLVRTEKENVVEPHEQQVNKLGGATFCEFLLVKEINDGM